ncbi:MAG: hypothetical protein HKO11_00355, partial [Eudoraea sp.]|nr:hypothetical protein [Eudoraea sp.]
FQQTYTRFLDLKKAEAQTRESQIQLSLERVRARSLAMKSSDELHEVLAVLFRQFDDLGIQPVNVFLSLFDKEKRTLTYRASGKSGKRMPGKQVVEVDSMEAIKALYDKWLNGNSDNVELIFFPKEVLPQLFGIFSETFSTMPKADRMGPEDFPEGGYSIAGYTPFGYLGYDHQRQATEEEQEILARFCTEFTRVYQRFLDLTNAEAQAREAQIETALERVRSRSMAMHKSEELADLSLELVKQVQALGVDTWFCAFNIYDDDSKGSLEWGSNGQGTFPKYRTPREGIFLRYYEAGQRGETLLINEIGEDECPAHYDYLCTLPGVGEQLLKMKDEGIPFPTSQIDHVAFFKYGYVLFITYEPSPESHEIFKRFAKVFEQTYTRFLDLQKAENQAREAQIEAALEKVRSSMMAMHKTEELHLVLKTLFEQMQSLGLEFQGSAIIIYDENLAAEHWMIGFSGEFPESYKLPYSEHPYCADMVKAWQKGVPFQEFFFEGELKVEYAKWALENSDFKHMPPEFKKEMLDPARLVLSEVFNKYGMLEIMGHEPLPKATVDILKRFSKVFEQSYTRFLDLKKAEAQAKEAQIEAALEKVRSASLAMHQSKDLHNVLVMLYNQLDALGLKMHSAQISESIEDPKAIHSWIVTNGAVYPEQVHIPFSKNIYFKRIREAVTNGESFYTLKLSKQQKDKHFHHIFDNSSLKNVPQERKDLIFSSPGLGTSNAMGKYTSLSIMRYDGILYSEEENEIIKRFAKVFEQSYTRFLDIQKAESQAREAKIEAAIEKVRSQSLAMHATSEMQQVANAVYDQLMELGLEMEAVGMSGAISAKQDYDVWVGGVPFGKALRIPYNENTKVQRDYNKMLEERPELFAKTYSGKDKEEYINHLLTHGDFPKALKKKMKTSETFSTSIALAKKSSIQILRYTDQPYSEEDNEILKRFSKVFEQAYIRFMDLEKAEAQARESQIEAALEKVRSRSLAMQKPEELQEVVAVVGNKLQELGVILDSGGVVICTYFPDSKDVMHWTATFDPAHPSVPYYLPYFDTPIWKETWASKWESDDDFFEKIFSFKDKNHFFHKAFEISDYKNLPEEHKKELLAVENHALSFAWQTNSALMIPSHTGKLLPEEHKIILKRFARVFEQAYIRFMDLQKAEAQAREAQIEAALEKVRSRTMAMHKSQELHKVVLTVSQEIRNLGLNISAAHIYRFEKGDKGINMWVAGDGGIYPNEVYFPYFKHQFFDGIYHARTTNKTFFTMSGTSKKEKNRLYRHLLNSSKIEISEDRKKYVLDAKSWAGIVALGKYSGIGVLRLTEEVEEEFSVEEYEILKRLSKVFEQA